MAHRRRADAEALGPRVPRQVHRAAPRAADRWERLRLSLLRGRAQRWAIGVLLVVVALATVPVTAEGLLAMSDGLIGYTARGPVPGWGPIPELVRSTLDQTPFERCGGVRPARAEAVARVREEVRATTGPNELARLGLALTDYNAAVSALMRGPCPGGATYLHDFVDFQYPLAYAAPLAWALDRFALSEIYVSLALLIGAWLGVVALFCVASKIGRSSVAGMLALAALLVTVRFFDLDVGHRAVLLAMFVPVWIAQVMCTHEPRRLIDRRVVAAAGAFAASALLSLFLTPLNQRVDVTMAVGVVLFAGLVLRSRVFLLRAALLLGVLLLVQLPYQAYSSRLLSPVSALNDAGSDDYLFVNLAMYAYERPSHYGFLNGDIMYDWVGLQDDYLAHASPALVVHQSFKPWGAAYLTDMLTSHPWTLVETWLKRIFDQLAFHRELSFDLYRGNAGVGIAVFAAGLAALVLALATRRRDVTLWPVAAVLTWQLFGINTLVALVHTHTLYLETGIWALWCLTPVLVVAAARGVWGVRASRSGHPRRRPSRRALAALGVAALGVAVLLPFGVREAWKESHAFRIWYAIHAGVYYPAAYRRPADLIAEAEAIRSLGGNDPGTVSIHAAWALAAHAMRTPSYIGTPRGIDYEADRQFAIAESKRLFHAALLEAPDDPHLPPYAELAGVDDWADIFRSALERDPRQPYAAMMAHRLLDVSSTAADRTRYATLYESAVGDWLGATVSYRPGFLRDPSGHGSADGTTIVLGPSERLALPARDAFGSGLVKLGVFAQALAGSADATLELGGAGCGTSSAIAVSDLMRYRLLSCDGPRGARSFRLVLRAGGDGARLLLRDYYPMVEDPRSFR